MPPIRTTFFAKFRMMKVSEFVPWRPGSAVRPGTSMTVNSGLCLDGAFVASPRMNRWRANRLCHACSVMIRIAIR